MQSAPPVNGGNEPYHSSKKEDRFKVGQYQDVWATILFIAGFIAFAALSVVGITRLKNAVETNKGSTGNSATIGSPGDLIGVLVTSVACGFVFSGIYFVLIQKFAGKMIVATMVMQVVLSVVLGVFMLMTGSVVGGVIILIFAGITAWFFYAWRSRIPFAKLMLKTVTGIIRQYPATFFTGLIGLVVSAVMAVWWIAGIAGVAIWVQETKMSSTVGYILNLYLVFFFYWSSQVIGNAVHLTVSGLFATYYFMGVSNGQGVTVSVRNPTVKAAKRAMTTSFGSNCYGSLLVAIIETLKFIANNARNQSSQEGNAGMAILACCLSCILSILQDILEYVNTYAFAQVAIYGKDYCTAAKDTWQLCKRRGVDAIVNDNLIGTVLGMGSILVGIFTGAIAFGCTSHLI